MTPAEWLAETGLPTMRPAEAAVAQTGGHEGTQEPGLEAEALPWVAVEELVHPVSPVLQPPPEGRLKALARGLALLAALVALLRSLLRDTALLRSSKPQGRLLLPYSAKSHLA
mmetsp:Transcript_108108/g.336086  ORF Transcript_108108/g.336086 Transcript_108108/m.336086 type:complete len:113 (-) Transcript_108108:144-482(-)